MSTPQNSPAPGAEPDRRDRTEEPDQVVVERTATTNHTDLVDRDDVVARERDRFGGIKFGSAFFGWLAALGTTVLLTAIVAASGVVVALQPGSDDVVDDADEMGAVTILGAIILVIVLFVAYLAGGYVAGRMARFNGAWQGVAVWLWAVVAAAVIAVLAAVAGNRFDIFANVDIFPRIPLDAADLTVAGIVTAVVLALVSLGGAIVGGIAGMRYHRRVDSVGLRGDAA